MVSADIVEQCAAQTPARITPPTREQILRMQDEVARLPQVEIPVEHVFGPGFYARTIHLAAGTVLVGKIHATEHIFFVSKGELLVACEDGSQIVKAGFQSIGRPGLKRVGYAVTDVTCTNIHITTETDLAKIEAQFIVPEPSPAIAFRCSEVLS
jgi:quercetin dioxygenase-like cupin family protein